jgi:hypothetical protein
MHSQAVGNESSETPETPESLLTSVLQAALHLKGCPICQAVRAAERQSIWSFLREGMMAPEIRNKFLDQGGFCPQHFWMAQDIEEKSWPAGGFGLAILCEQLLIRVEQQMVDDEKCLNERKKAQLFWRKEKAPWSVQTEACLFCLENEKRELMYADALEGMLEDDDCRLSFSKNPLCMRHSLLCLNAWKLDKHTKWLHNALQEYVAELKKDAHEFISKHDYRRRNEPPGREAEIVKRAKDFLLGVQDG